MHRQQDEVLKHETWEARGQLEQECGNALGATAILLQLSTRQATDFPGDNEHAKKNQRNTKMRITRFHFCPKTKWQGNEPAHVANDFWTIVINAKHLHELGERNCSMFKVHQHVQH